jgi:hypothetical protein
MNMNLNTRLMKQGAIVLFALLMNLLAFNPKTMAQIYEPEGLNMPGTWNGWVNPPANKLALASATQVPGGKVTKITTGIPRWQTTLKIAATGGDTTGGTYAFLFTSGPSGNPWANAWKDVIVKIDTLQAYNYYTSGGTNNSVTLLNGKWYTVNWKDAGYANTDAIFMQTSGAPVDIVTVTQTPSATSVHNGQSVSVHITLSTAPSSEEKFYVRYSNDDYTTSFLAPVTINANSGNASIPALSDTVSYYVFSTTVANPVNNHDMYTIKFNNNDGPNYSFVYKTGVLFKVDMSQQTVSPNGVHLVGDFQGWDSIATPMTLAGNGIYSVTVPVNTSSYQEYKFLNGNSFAGEETVPAACGADNGVGGFNRYLTIPESDTTLPVVCFSSCSACPLRVPVTFAVDMSLETVSASGIHLAGNFQGWNSSSTPMTDIGNNVYTASVMIDTAYHAEYKFINGSTWEEAEAVPESCGVPDGQGGFNRFFTVPATGTGITLPTVCYSLCSICPVGIESPTDISALSVYPNPATDILYITLNIKTACGILAELYNTDGMKVYHNLFEKLSSGQNALTLSPGHLPKGIYYLILNAGNDNNELVTRKIVFQ